MPDADDRAGSRRLTRNSVDDAPPDLLERLKGLVAARQASLQDDATFPLLSERTAVAVAALRAVLDDAERVRGVRPWMEVVYDRGLRIAYLRALFIAEEPTQGLDALNPAEALVEVADAVFDLLADEDWQVPFVCPEHGFGLHPLLDDGRAVWWCRPPNHVVAEIGRLGPATG